MIDKFDLQGVPLLSVKFEINITYRVVFGLGSVKWRKCYLAIVKKASPKNMLSTTLAE